MQLGCHCDFPDLSIHSKPLQSAQCMEILERIFFKPGKIFVFSFRQQKIFCQIIRETSRKPIKQKTHHAGLEAAPHTSRQTSCPSNQSRHLNTTIQHSGDEAIQEIVNQSDRWLSGFPSFYIVRERNESSSWLSIPDQGASLRDYVSSWPRFSVMYIQVRSKPR